MKETIISENLGRIRYKKAWEYQEHIFKQVLASKTNSEIEPKQYLLLCEHEPVYTLGKSGNEENLLLTEYMRETKNIEYFLIDRGGDITYHGPGQLVVYPIIDLERHKIGIKKYISMLEDVVINVLSQYGIHAEKDEKAMGVWLDAKDPLKARKICAVGVRVSRFVTMHGLALNINTDLNYFNYINPCGFTDKQTTSMQKELGKEIDFYEVTKKIESEFQNIFSVELLQSTKEISN